MIKCKICTEEFKSFALLSSHIRFKHNMKSYDYSLKYVYNGKIPLCKCGCGKETNWVNISHGFNKFIKGHSVKYKTNYFENKCVICGKKFKTDKSTKNYCSRECYLDLQHVNTHEIRKCKICNTEFNCNKMSTQTYCSRECSRKDTELYDKMKKTTLERYGVDNFSKTDEFKSYMADNTHFKNPLFQQQSKNTKLLKYNDELYNNREKIKDWNIKRLYNRLISSDRLKDLVTPLFNIDEYTGRKLQYPFKCNKCDYEFKSNLDNGRVPRCPNCFPIIKNDSKGENELYDYIKSLLPNVIVFQNYTKLLPNESELDIYIPDLNLAFEYNGLYWHSIKYKNKFYHKWKQDECLKHNVNLIHIFENEWLFKKEIVKSIIRNKLKLTTNKIYARKCKLKKVSNKDSTDFLNTNHIQGTTNSSIRIGLYYNDILVSLLTIGKSRFDKKIEYEILRFVTKIDNVVVGGFNKLLKYFYLNYNPKSIISYVDKRYFTGGLYNNTNFNQVTDYDRVNYYYFKHYDVYNRIEFQKHKLKDKLEIFDESLTEFQNMELNGYNRIYDCGNYKYIWYE